MSRRAQIAGWVALVAAALGFSGGARAESPQVLYMLHCQGCHLADGSGKAGTVPDLRDFVGRFLLVPGGRAYLVRVPGSAQSPVGDAELAALLNWMIRRFGPPSVAADFDAYSEAEVTGYRAEPLADVSATRAALLTALDQR